jgi:UDP:flavonoid glycosyltransferase YjiC (YdhE family)
VSRVLGRPDYGRRAAELRDWAAENDGSTRAADAVEELAARPSRPLQRPSQTSKGR